MDDLGGGNTNDLGSCSSLATFKKHTTSSDASASFVSTPFLTNTVSLLSLSDKSTSAFRRRELRSINNQILPQKLDTKELPENKETPESSEKTVPAFFAASF